MWLVYCKYENCDYFFKIDLFEVDYNFVRP